MSKYHPFKAVMGCYGSKAPQVLASRCIEWMLIRVVRPKTFMFSNKAQLPYYMGLWNGAFRNERCVEIPIVMQHYDKTQNILEVGNTIDQYFNMNHLVVDRDDPTPGIVNKDIIDYNTPSRFDYIFSVSTIEHIPDCVAAWRKMKSLLKPSGRLVVTGSLGFPESTFNNRLKRDLFDDAKITYMMRVDKRNTWMMTVKQDALVCKYDEPYTNANAIAVLEKI